MRRHALPEGSIKSGTRFGRTGALALVTAVISLFAIPAGASAGSEVINFFGTVKGGGTGTGTLGGEFEDPADIVVNETGAGGVPAGTIYVADEENHRVQRFSPGETFVSAWGADVIQAGKPGGIAGVNPFEICTVAKDCKEGVPTDGNGDTSGNGALHEPVSIAVDGDTGNVYVSDLANRRIYRYSATGEFIASFGFDVDATEAATGFEVCPATNVCKAGVAGDGTGQIGAAGSGLGIAVSPADGNAATGTLYLADPGNQRVNTYELDGSSPSSLGSAAVFEVGQPRAIAVDSRGIVYASNAIEGGRIERYDSLDANGGGAIFLDPIAAQLNHTQTIEFVEGRVGDTFTLTCPDGKTTDPITFGFSMFSRSEKIDAALTKECGGSFSAVSKGELTGFTTVTFEGIYAGTDSPPMVCTVVTSAIAGATCKLSKQTPAVKGPLLENSAFPEGATAGLEVDPDTDGGGSDSDILYVLRRGSRVQTGATPGTPPITNTVVQQLGPNNAAGLSVSPAAVDDTHGENAGFTSNVLGLGFSEQLGKLFVSSNRQLSSPGGAQVGGGHRVYTLGDPTTLAPPAVTMSDVTVKADTTATLSANVDPMGALIACRFQYSTDQLSWIDVEASDCLSLVAAGGSQTVSEEVTGLDPNTHYFVRLVASRPFISGATKTSNVKAFDTDAPSPGVSHLGAVQVEDKSARLVATVDPRRSPTAYVFEYGPTAGLGSSTAPLAIGDGAKPITVSQQITGLTPGTTYYFRVTATNLTGSTVSPGETFKTRTDPLPLAPDRRYEQVSPLDKNYGDADSGYGVTRAGISIDGDAVGYCPSNQFGEPPGRMLAICSPYISRRTADGWVTRTNLPKFCHIDTNSGDSDGLIGLFPSADFSRTVVMVAEAESCPIPPLSPLAPMSPTGPSFNLYLQNATVDPPTYDLINTATRSKPQVEANDHRSQFMVGASDDFSHVVFRSKQNQTPEPDSPPQGEFDKLYDWEQQGEGDCTQPGGCLTLVSKDTNNEPFTTRSGVASIFTFSGTGRELDSSVSADGSRIFFANSGSDADFPFGNNVDAPCPQAGCDIYLRENQEVTFHVSASECTVDCGSPQMSGDFMLSATPSGAKAFFASCARLSDDASPQATCNEGVWGSGSTGVPGSKLYRWDRDGAPGHKLVDVTADHEPFDGEQPTLRRLIDESDDGDAVFFTAQGQIVSGAPTVEGEKLYRWRWNGGNPHVDYLGSYDPVKTRWTNDMNVFEQQHQVSSDGKYLMLFTKLAYDPAIDRDTDVDIYRWDEEGGWICASCQGPGVPSNGDVDLSSMWLEYTTGFFPETGNNEPKTYMSSDGQRIFFGTPDALVPEDVNGNSGCPLEATLSAAIHTDVYTCEDVYEWHDGAVHLVSSGTSNEPSRLIAASPDGRDVTFFTRQQLVGWDIDDNVDVYDARIGGGFPEPPPQPPTCEGEACRGIGTSALPVAPAGTAVFQGPGNPPVGRSQPRCGKGKRKVRRAGKVRCVKRKRAGRTAAERRAHRNDRRTGR